MVFPTSPFTDTLEISKLDGSNARQVATVEGARIQRIAANNHYIACAYQCGQGGGWFIHDGNEVLQNIELEETAFSVASKKDASVMIVGSLFQLHFCSLIIHVGAGGTIYIYHGRPLIPYSLFKSFKAHVDLIWDICIHDGKEIFASTCGDRTIAIHSLKGTLTFQLVISMFMIFQAMRFVVCN